MYIIHVQVKQLICKVYTVIPIPYPIMRSTRFVKIVKEECGWEPGLAE